jgi:hypothetical protein
VNPFVPRRTPLAEIANRNLQAIAEPEATERMHVAVAKHKYRGQQFVPVDEPWFQDEPQSSAADAIGGAEWPFV